MGSGGGDRGHGKGGHHKGSKSSRNRSKGGSKSSSRSGHRSRSSTYMTRDRARAIQSHADKADRNQGFKGRAMSAADRHEKDDDFD